MFDRTVENSRRMTVTEPKVTTMGDRFNLLTSIEASQKQIERHIYNVVCVEADTQAANAKLAKLEAALRVVAESL